MRFAPLLLVVRLLALPATVFPSAARAGTVLECAAKDTLTAVELDPGDTFRFKLRSGQVRSLVLDDASAAIVERVAPGGVVYRFACRVHIDGHAMSLERYACTQESFYEPYVVNGLRIWLDSVADSFQQIPIRYPRTGNLDAHPHKRARLAVQDATLSICPEETRLWLPRAAERIEVGECYNGDDCWMGPYLGQACHVGLDINHAKGDPLWAPISVDDHWFFHSLKAGQENNRWRGIRHWPNGDLWAIQTHHLIELLVPEHTPLRAGTKYSTTAGVFVGSHPHTHFEFKVVQPTGSPLGSIDFDAPTASQPAVIHLDPWIVFWQVFEDAKRRRQEPAAVIRPLAPGRTGQPVECAADMAGPGTGGTRRCFWTFGDGGEATGPRVVHVFARAGVYPVTLVVDDGRRRVTRTQHVTIDGDPLAGPCLALAAAYDPAFRPRPIPMVDVYGAPPRCLPHTLEFTARPSRPVPQARTIQLQNIGGGRLPPASPPQIDYWQGRDWLQVERHGGGNGQALRVSANGSGVAPGSYLAEVTVACPGAANASQSFRVLLRIPAGPPSAGAVVDDRDPSCYATPYFWIGHRFCNCQRKGFAGFYLTNGGRATGGELVRFTPDLRAGRYQVALRPETPFAPGTEFRVRVRHKTGEQSIAMRPVESRVIGDFDWDEGTDGFAEIQADGSRGLVVADAVEFRRR